MSSQTPAEQRSEQDRLATGLSEQKWASMSRAERRAWARAARRVDKRRRRS